MMTLLPVRVRRRDSVVVLTLVHDTAPVPFSVYVAPVATFVKTRSEPLPAERRRTIPSAVVKVLVTCGAPVLTICSSNEHASPAGRVMVVAAADEATSKVNSPLPTSKPVRPRRSASPAKSSSHRDRSSPCVGDARRMATRAAVGREPFTGRWRVNGWRCCLNPRLPRRTRGGHPTPFGLSLLTRWVSGLISSGRGAVDASVGRGGWTVGLKMGRLSGANFVFSGVDR